MAPRKAPDSSAKDPKSITVSRMISNIISSVNVSRAAKGKDAPYPTGPLFTFLVGSGFTLTAGVPSTRHLVAALEDFQKDPGRTWQDVFEKTRLADYPSGCDLTKRYFELIGDVCKLPPARHAFITSAIRWAASNHVQMNLESIMLASVLIAGSGGAVQLDPQRHDRRWLAHAFASHVFTTNFDEVLPTTFYLGNQPVDVTDGPALRGVSSAAEYPSVIYLHGRHLHYDLRNTPQELAFQPTEANAEMSDPFTRFRDLLRNTGLVVIGYSGAEDRVMDCIQRAADDPNSLPYGLYWSAYKSETDLDQSVQRLIRACDRAFYLDAGKKADEILTSLCRELSIDGDHAIYEWSTHAGRATRTIQEFLKNTSYEMRRFLATAVDAARRFDPKKGQDAIHQWQERQSTIRQHHDDSLTADILLAVAELHRLYGRPGEDCAFYRDALELHRKVGDDLGAASDCKGLTELFVVQRDARHAEENLALAKDFLAGAPDAELEMELALAEGRLCALKVDNKAARGMLEAVRDKASSLGYALIATDAGKYLAELDKPSLK